MIKNRLFLKIQTKYRRILWILQKKSVLQTKIIFTDRWVITVYTINRPYPDITAIIFEIWSIFGVYLMLFWSNLLKAIYLLIVPLWVILIEFSRYKHNFYHISCASRSGDETVLVLVHRPKILFITPGKKVRKGENVCIQWRREP